MATNSKPNPTMIATHTFVCEVQGHDHYIRTGDQVMAFDPVAKAHPDWFRPAEATD